MTARKYWKILILLSFAGALYGIVNGIIERRNLSKWPKKYVYSKIESLNNSAMYIRNLKYETEYFKFIEKIKDEKKEEIPVNFPIENRLPQGAAIYFIRFVDNKKLIEFYSPEYHNSIWGFKTGYIYSGFVVDTLF